MPSEYPLTRRLPAFCSSTVCQHVVRARVRQADGAAERSQMVTARAPGMEVRRLEHRADRQRGTVELRVGLAEHERAPAGRRRQAEEHPQRRRLPRTVRAEKARDRPGLERERQVIDGENRLESLRERLSNNRRQDSTALTRAVIPRNTGRQDIDPQCSRSERDFRSGQPLGVTSGASRSTSSLRFPTQRHQCGRAIVSHLLQA